MTRFLVQAAGGYGLTPWAFPSIRIHAAKPAGESLEAAYVRKSIRAKYQMPE